LKKQTQFVGWQISLNSYLKGYYVKIMLIWARKNKPEQSQFARAECCGLIPACAGMTNMESLKRGKFYT